MNADSLAKALDAIKRGKVRYLAVLTTTAKGLSGVRSQQC